MFDNVCKFLAENFSSDLARWLLGEPIGLTKLNPTELLVEPIRALDKEVIRQVLREEIMRESVIYQDIVAQATAKGKAEGIQEGEASLVLRQLKRRIGEVDSELEVRIRSLSVAQLEDLGEALLEFASISDLLAWLESH
jgi:predicted transposase YdaD